MAASKHLVISSTLLLTVMGCGGPTPVGKWESENSSLVCGRVEFEIDADLTGSGEACACDFEVEFEERDDGDWIADVDYEGGLDCAFANDGRFDCELNDDGDELDCEEIGEYDRVD